MSRLRSTLVLLAVVLSVVTAVGAAAWSASPSADRLLQRARQRTGHAGLVSASGVAPILVEAVVATEDERFRRHHGIDLIGLARAIPYDLAHASFAQGASTITEQVAKLLYLGGNDHTPWRKLEDMALAVKLEDRYSKSEILAAYLNTAYFGDNAYGVAAASGRYFATTPDRLTLAQASLLAGLPQAPSAYDPLLHPAAARRRQLAVLRSLVRVGAVSPGRARAVLFRPLPLRGGGSLPPLRAADVAPGPALSWPNAAMGGALAALGVALACAKRRRPSGTLASSSAGILAAALVVLGAAAIARSFRSL